MSRTPHVLVRLARPVAVALCLVLSTLVVGVAATAPASAAPDRCVSNAEFVKVKKGMTVPRVKQVVGFNGRFHQRLVVSQDYVIVKRRYRLCASRTKVAEIGYVSVQGGPYKVTRKVKVAR
ncbi:hypothetical protein [Nocardioides sp.]|uniref:hypothetical protein n=1 Tax=Nocardioides sp. TaxID=35761 RepID=UPI0027242E62|nr:hypothetical protein [Nocardioides sp.]MDO9456764.1 hypothetical protein [Nocardioides sp.]